MSEHPLSDEESSVLDERLIGHWDIKLGDSESMDPIRMVVGRDPKADNILESVTTTIDAEKRVNVHRGHVYTAKVGDQWIVSFGGPDEQQPPKIEYMIMRYELKPRTADSNDLLEMHLLLDSFVATAIEKGELTGTVKRDKPGGKFTSIKITAEPKELMEFVTKHQAKCFTPDAFKVVRATKG
jgi:hypothetical protein